MRTRHCVVFSAVVFLMASSIAGAQQESPSRSDATGYAPYRPECVDAYGDPQRLVIEGTATFSAAAIAEELKTDFDVLVAAHPFAVLEEYCSTLQEKVAAGYQHAGFPDVQVAGRVNRNLIRVELTVEEGPRYTIGDVQIRGAKTIDVAGLTRRLTTSYPPEDALPKSYDTRDGKIEVQWVDKDGKPVELKDPIWERGKPAPFDEPTRSSLRAKTKRALADLGYFFAEFEIDIVRDSDARTAALLVNVADEGPKALIGRIEVVGSRKNTREDVLRYLDIEPGMLLTAERRTQLGHRLWQSGRFLKSQVTPQEPTAAGEPVTLRIELKEYDKAPSLSETLSTEEQVLLRLRDFLADTSHWDGDLVLSGKPLGFPMEWVISPEHGALLVLGTEPKDEQKPPFELQVIASKEAFGLYSPTNGKKLMGTPTKVQAVGQVSFSVDEKAEDPEKPFHVVFGLGFKSLDEEEPPQPFRLDLTLDPCAFVGIAHQADAQCTLSDGMLVVETSESQNWRIDAESGRLLECAMTDEDGQSRMRISFVSGALERRVKEITDAGAGYANQFDPEYPVSSLLEFLCDEQLVSSLVELDPKARRGLGVVRTILQKRALEPLDNLIATGGGSDREKFKIPEDGRAIVEQIGMNPLVLGVRIVLPYYGKLFPYDSWPWTVGREAALIAIQRAEHTGAVLEQLFESEENGPLCFLVTGTLLQRMSPQAARAFAAKGLTKLSEADFRNDYRILLSPNCVAGKCAIKIAEVLRDLDEEEVKLLDAALFGEEATVLTDAAEILRRRPDRPVTEVLPEAFDRLWEGGLRQRVESALRGLIEESTPDATELTQAYPR